MTTVTARIGEVIQPPHGYIDPLSMEHVRFSDDRSLGKETIPPTLVGTVVDYLSRFMLGAPPGNAFGTCLKGAYIANRYREASRYFSKITDMDDESIRNSCRLSTFESYYRAGAVARAQPVDLVIDDQTCDNIRTMVERTVSFFDANGPVVEMGFTFPGAFTRTIDSGDGDYLTRTGLWDMKVSKQGPTIAHTLQILVYYVMGIHSTNPNFDSIETIGIFNPRLNCADSIRIEDIDGYTLKIVENYIIGYEPSDRGETADTVRA